LDRFHCSGREGEEGEEGEEGGGKVLLLLLCAKKTVAVVAPLDCCFFKSPPKITEMSEDDK